MFTTHEMPSTGDGDALQQGSKPKNVTPWRSSMIAATLKRRLALGDDDEFEKQQSSLKQDISAVPIADEFGSRERRPPLPARKKNQVQKNFEDVISDCSKICPHLGQTCRMVSAKLKDLPHADTEREMESVNKLLEVSMLKGIQNLEECDCFDSRFGEDVSAIMSRVAKEPVTKQLEALVAKGSQIVAVFGKVADDVDTHESSLNALLEVFDLITRDMAETKHAAEDFLQAVIKRHDELASKATSLDKDLEEFITMNSASPLRPGRTMAASKHLSMTLDVIQSGDPKIMQLMQERRHACEMQKIAMQEFELRAKELELRKALCILCEAAGSRMEDNVNESRLRGFNNRCKTLEDAFHHVREVVTQLEIVLSQVGELQKQRAQNAQEKLDKLQRDIEEHKRLYSEDEAPTERRDLEGRIAEFSEVIKRSKQAVIAAVQQQADLWSTKGVPDPVKSHVYLRLGPVVRSMPFVEELNSKSSTFFSTSQQQLSAVDALRIPLVTTKPVEAQWGGYDSDDFFETDDTSSAASSKYEKVVPPQTTSNFGYVKETEVREAEESNGSGCSIM